MVRTHVGASAVRFDVSRILAFSAAIALHLLALGMLLIPLSQVSIRADTSRVEPRWILPELIRVTPVPPAEPVPVIAPTTPPPTRHALPVLLERAPLPVFATEAVISSNATTLETPTADASAASLTKAPPLQGISLQYLSAPAPAYPREAMRTGAQGTVVLRVLVDESGAPIEVSIERSSGNRSLDNAARNQVLRRWKFRPALDNGRAVQAYGLIPVDFTLQ